MKTKWRVIACVCALFIILGSSTGCSNMIPLLMQMDIAKDNTECNDSADCDVLHWIESESRYEGCEIDGDVAKIKYTIVFENHDEEACTVSFLRAKLTYSEVRDWIGYQQFYEGTLEDGSSETVIPAGERREIVYIFTAEYMEGEIKSDLSAPVEIMFIEK